MKSLLERRAKRHGRVRKKVSGTTERPRVNVFRSTNHLYVQAINDVEGRTLVGASTKAVTKSGGNIKAAELLGKHFAKLLNEKGIKKVVLDRGGYKYHGRIKALAEALRADGISL